MILINLLPHREEKRRRRRQAFFMGLGAAALAGAAIALGWNAVLGELTAQQNSRNTFLQSEIQRLENQIKDIASLKTEIEALKARGHEVREQDMTSGLQAIARGTQDGRTIWRGSADPRREGVVLGD